METIAKNKNTTAKQDQPKGDIAMDADTTNNNAATEQSQRITTLETNLEFIKEQLSDVKQDLKDLKQGQENIEARLNTRIDDLIKWYVPTTVVALLLFAAVMKFL
ncbi:MAG: hypothetical protein F4Y79_05945 [Gemmatimonadetes bacterium]|nr:hypothetical protein [Gemmatimonadota bacterium]